MARYWKRTFNIVITLICMKRKRVEPRKGVVMWNDTLFVRFWNTVYGGVLPLGYHLRTEFAERWLRFHSLPFSKRYARSDDEYAVVFERQNAVASHVLACRCTF